MVDTNTREVLVSYIEAVVKGFAKEITLADVMNSGASGGQEPLSKGAQPSDLQMQTGAVKMDAGKTEVFSGLLAYFPYALAEVAYVSGGGFDKYGEWGGWAHVSGGERRYHDALGRHLLAYAAGERVSDDPKLRPGTLILAQIAWNALAILEQQVRDGVEADQVPLGAASSGRPPEPFKQPNA